MNTFAPIRPVLFALMLMGIGGTALSQELEPITIAPSSASLPAGGLRLADELGLFAKHGLDADITPMESGAVATMALLSGTVDFNNSGPIDVVINNVKGQDIGLVMSIYRGNPGVLVLSKSVVDRLGVAPDAPIEERLKAIDGLSIATPSAVSTYTVAARSVETVGGSVNLIYMAQPAMVAALQTGAIDGYVASSPFWTDPVLRGEAVVWISGPAGEWPDGYSPVNAVTVHSTGRLASEKPEVIAAMRAVGVDLAKTFRENPVEAKAAISRLFPDISAEALDLIYEIEAPAFGGTTPPTEEELRKEIAFSRLSGAELPPDEEIDAAAMLLP